MTATTEPTDVPVDITRDRWGRPLISVTGPDDLTDFVAYTRVSTLAKSLDDMNGLMKWKARKTVEGLVRRPDLVTRASGALATGDPDEHWPTKRELNDIVEEATEAAGATKGRSAGTGFHALTDALDRGTLDWSLVAGADVPRLEAYQDAMDDYEVLDIETFVVNDTIRAAGTFDRLVRCPDGRVRVADLKSGKSEAEYPFGTTVQISVYANSERYEPATGTRSPLHPDIDLTTGLLIHLPATGGCRVILLDLEVGWEAARVAVDVRRFRALKAADIIKAASW